MLVQFAEYSQPVVRHLAYVISYLDVASPYPKEPGQGNLEQSQHRMLQHHHKEAPAGSAFQDM